VFLSPVRHYLHVFLGLCKANREIINKRFVYKFCLPIGVCMVKRRAGLANVCFKAGQGCKSYSYRLQHISEEWQRMLEIIGATKLRWLKFRLLCADLTSASSNNSSHKNLKLDTGHNWKLTRAFLHKRVKKSTSFSRFKTTISNRLKSDSFCVSVLLLMHRECLFHLIYLRVLGRCQAL